MKTNRNAKQMSLGAVVEKLLEQGNALADDTVAAADLAAHRLERVLARGGNMRLAFGLANLGRELAPVSSRRHRRHDADPVLSARAA